MKITKEMLNKINDLTKYHYRNDSNTELEAHELVAQAWVKAVNSVLSPEIVLEFPERANTESVFED